MRRLGAAPLLFSCPYSLFGLFEDGSISVCCREGLDQMKRRAPDMIERRRAVSGFEFSFQSIE